MQIAAEVDHAKRKVNIHVANINKCNKCDLEAESTAPHLVWKITTKALSFDAMGA